ncbi:hypothetical protein DN069_16070 [Streptacidiphilus pinicola]|uniref:Integral membrane protein n=2 Tax=Streptacidiphilus pinicola TaxID=2219663 RepID=A0A2X0IMZ0_9ACTN|nr:hypothetical protein DN069_16070 [Streptacidiphilus pinicola]
MERHQELYADAVDPLDIAEGLERSGVGPQTAGRYRHGDVFSLAEELHVRVPRRAVEPPPVVGAWQRRATPAVAAGAAFAAVALLLWGLRALDLPVPPGAQVAVFTAVAVPTVGRGLPLPERALLALGVGGVLALGQGAGPPQLALAVGVGAAEWCARWYRHLGAGHVRARSSREFRSRMRPVLPAVALVYLAVLAGLTAAALALPAAVAGPGAAAQVAHAAHASYAAQAGWRSQGAVWAAQGGAGVALLLTLLLRHGDRTPTGLAALAAACGCVGLARVVPPHPDLTTWACALTAGSLLPYAWITLLSPAAHRPPPAGPDVTDAAEPGP